ncbi:hypothetical protein Syun_002145 [Stephania yunnanensis]|uniref:Uncharacterized protein n=1 Tax=Stephania yunnanensis TaxID=152371 RepID=A0AAP0Q760_9MAGN
MIPETQSRRRRRRQAAAEESGRSRPCESGPNQRRGRLRMRPGGGQRLGEVRAATAWIRPAAATRCPMNHADSRGTAERMTVCQRWPAWPASGASCARSNAARVSGARSESEADLERCSECRRGEPATMQRPATVPTTNDNDDAWWRAGLRMTVRRQTDDAGVRMEMGLEGGGGEKMVC